MYSIGLGNLWKGLTDTKQKTGYYIGGEIKRAICNRVNALAF